MEKIGTSISRRTRSRSEAYLLSCFNQIKEKRDLHSSINHNGKTQSSETEKSIPMADYEDGEASPENSSDRGNDSDYEFAESKRSREVVRPKKNGVKHTSETVRIVPMTGNKEAEVSYEKFFDKDNDSVESKRSREVVMPKKNKVKHTSETVNIVPIADNKEGKVSPENYGGNGTGSDDNDDCKFVESKGSGKVENPKKTRVTCTSKTENYIDDVTDEVHEDEVITEKISDDDDDGFFKCVSSRKVGRPKMKKARLTEEHRIESRLDEIHEDEDDVISENFSDCDDGGYFNSVNLRKVGRPTKRKKAHLIEEHRMESMLEDWRLKETNFVRDSSDSGVDNPVIGARFKFEEDDEKSCEEKTDLEKEIDSLFDHLNWGLMESEDGSSTNSSINDEASSISEVVDEYPKARCDRGDHEVILDEEIGLFCKYCSLVLLDIKHVLPPLVQEENREKNRRKFFYDESENATSRVDFRYGSGSENLEKCMQSNAGTVFDLIPESSKELYPHQLEGFEFLWRNIAGDIHIKNLQQLPSNGGCGCIISHAPGTGKTRLTIVFLQTLMKLYPNCRPVIIAPRGMLLSWEQELQKWSVSLSFHNLNETTLTSREKEMLVEVSGSKNRKTKKSTDMIRYIKLLSWMKGGSVLGVGYRLFESLAGETAGKFKKVLLESPGVIVMDEGHTPRNEQSLMWKALRKVKTFRRVILSGTPFQNNFTELYNTLCLVNPSFCCRIRSRGRPGRRPKDEWGVVTDSINRFSANDDDGLKKLRLMMKPFVHIHRGSILEKALPGLRDSLVVLKPTVLQEELLQSTLHIKNPLEQNNTVSLISVHPWLVSEKPEFSDWKTTLESLKWDPNAGVKMKFLVKLIRLSTTLNEKVLIFSEFLPPLIHIQKLLKSHFKWNIEKEIIFMFGDMKLQKRQQLIHCFNDRKSDAKVMLASQRACSEGISLVGASRVVLLDVAWNPAVERQAICRAYRLGQEKMVYVYHLITAIEVNKFEKQVEKERISELIFSGEGGGGGGDVGVGKDHMLEAMVRHEKEGKSMFERIVHQPKETDLVNSFGFVDF